MADNSEKICFVIMPIGKHDDKSPEYWKSIYEDIIKPAVEYADSSIKCFRADDEAKSGQITPDIIGHLKQSFICIADVTGKNPNVYYELGLRDSWHNRTITITQNFGDIVFDRSDIRALSYKVDDSKAQSEFNRKMKEAILDILKNPNKVRNKVQEMLNENKGVSDNNRFKQMMKSKEVTKGIAKINSEKRIANLLPFMGYKSDNHAIKTSEFFSPYVKVKNGKNTLLLIMKGFHPSQSEREYIVELALNLDKLIEETLSYNILLSVIDSSNAKHKSPLPKINEISNVKLVMPYEGILNDKSQLIETIEYHYEIKIKGPKRLGLLIAVQKSTRFLKESGNLSIEVWDFEKLNELESAFRLSFSN